MVSMNAALPLPELRDAVAAEVEASSLRTVARLAGLSAAGLAKFLEGAQPMASTRRRLERWYVLHGPGRVRRGTLDPQIALSVLRVLVQDLTPGRQRPTLEALVRSLGDAYRLARMPEPAWLDEVRAGLHGEVE
jgi:hypothetical protein